MSEKLTLFDRFGGTRKMAEALNEPPSTVQSWKTAGRIPAFKQPDVFAKALELGLEVTADDIIFPLGREDMAEARYASATKSGEDIGQSGSGSSSADNLCENIRTPNRPDITGENIRGPQQAIEHEGEADSHGPFSLTSSPTCGHQASSAESPSSPSSSRGSKAA